MHYYILQECTPTCLFVFFTRQLLPPVPVVVQGVPVAAALHGGRDATAAVAQLGLDLLEPVLDVVPEVLRRLGQERLQVGRRVLALEVVQLVEALPRLRREGKEGSEVRLTSWLLCHLVY